MRTSRRMAIYGSGGRERVYTLNPIDVKGGIRSSWSSAYWSSMSLMGNTGERCFVGRDSSGNMMCTYFLFDETELAALRTKNIVSAKLVLNVMSGTIPAVGTTSLQIGYKLNNLVGTTSQNQAWQRGDVDSTAASVESIGYICTDTASSQVASDTPVEIALPNAIPLYGFVAGGVASGGANVRLNPTAQLVVVAN